MPQEMPSVPVILEQNGKYTNLAIGEVRVLLSGNIPAAFHTQHYCLVAEYERIMTPAHNRHVDKFLTRVVDGLGLPVTFVPLAEFDQKLQAVIHSATRA